MEITSAGKQAKLVRSAARTYSWLMTKLLLLLAISTAACATQSPTTAASRRAIIDTPCAACSARSANRAAPG